MITFATAAWAISWLLLVGQCMNVACGAASVASQAEPARRPGELSQADLEQHLLSAVPDASEAVYLGLSYSNEFVAAVAGDPHQEKDRAFWIDASSGRTVRSLPLHALYTGNLLLGRGGRVLLAANRFLAGSANCIQALGAEDMRPLGRSVLPQATVIEGLFAIPGDTSTVAVPALSLVPSHGKVWLSDPHLELWNWRRNREEKRLNYEHAPTATDVVVAADRRRLLFVFDDDLRNTFGIVDVVSGRSGAIEWHIEGSDDRPVGSPAFFISTHQFVVRENIYDLTTHKVVRFLGGAKGMRCVSGVSGQPHLVFVESASGLELWDLTRARRRASWAGIKNVGRVFISPDRTILAVLTSPDVSRTVPPLYEHPILSFWRIPASLFKE